MKREKSVVTRRRRRAPSKAHQTRNLRRTTANPNAEVSALNATLQETGQRLEDLTAGEMDSLADRDGRTFLLRRAQDQLRVSEAAKQTAILNALPAHIALLDTQGLILSANVAWRRFAGANALQSPQVGIGVNYLEICDRAEGDDSSWARQAAVGIRSVLHGVAKRFSIEYPCHSPTEQRWFLMTATPLSEGIPSGAVVTHTDITAEKRKSEELRRSETLKGAILESSLDCVITMDHEGRILEFNPAAQATFGFTRDQVLGMDMVELIVPPRLRNAHRRGFARYLATGKGPILGKRLELEAIRADGTEFPIELAITAIAASPTPIFTGFIRDITELKRAAEAFRTSEREQRRLTGQLEIERSRLVAAQRVAKVGSWETDLATMSVIWSEETHRIFDTDPATFHPVRHDFVEFVHPDDRAAVDEAFGRSLKFDQSIASTITYRIRLPDGRIKFVEEHWHVFFDDQKNPARLAGTCQDITERKKIEEEIYEARTFLASIFDNIPNSIFVKDARHLRFVRANTACEKLTGYAEKEFLGKSDHDFFPKDQADFFVAQDRETLAGNQQLSVVEEIITSKDGTKKLLQTKKFPILDRDGNPQYLLGMSEDITERKRAELSLRESEGRFRSFAEQSPDAMIIHQAGRIVFVNAAMVRLMRAADADALLGKPGTSLLQAEYADLAEKRRDRLYSGKTVPLIEQVYLRSDGTTVDVEAAASPIVLDGHPAALVTVRDITNRRTQEQKLSRLSRIHAVLSGINAAIVRIRDRRELFREACRIIVQQGGFTLGWIAVLDHATGKLMAVAQAGLTEKAAAEGAFFNGSAGLVPAGVADDALRRKHSAIDNLIEDRPGSANAENERDTMQVRRIAIGLGAKSVIVLPLVVEKETFGILTLYAPEKNFFDDEEIKLLNDLAGDISFGLEFIAKEEKVDYLAYYDALTGLANRRLFLERVAQYMRSAVGGGQKLALFLIDLERFKNINDSLGRPAGDALLKQVSEFLSRDAGDPNLLARLGGDHFAIVLPELKQEGNVAHLLDKRIQAFIDHPFRLNDTEYRIPIKVGVALFPNDGTDADTLLQNAETALKKAKASGDRYLLYTQTMTATVAGRLTLENQLRRALDKCEFVLHYQPKANLVSGKITGAEALIRWNDPRTGLVPPGRFIPILEETGLIYEVGRWALRQAIDDYLRWRSAGLAAVRIAVNVSPLQLRSRGFIADIEQAIGIDVHAAAGLDLEITESLIMDDVKHNIASLQAIRVMGVGIAIDDFGTGFSSLSYLSKLPVDTLKIDRSFVVDMTAGPEGLALVSTIINLAHSLKLKVVAEGVETGEQSRLLRLLKCDEMQGYLFSKPVPAAIFEEQFLIPFPSGEDSITPAT